MVDNAIVLLNVMACFALGIAASWAVLSPVVDDRVLVKAGLICVALGFLATGLALAGGVEHPGSRGINRALLLVHLGLVVVAIGYCTRVRRHRSKRRRATDWMALDSREVDSV